MTAGKGAELPPHLVGDQGRPRPAEALQQCLAAEPGGHRGPAPATANATVNQP